MGAKLTPRLSLVFARAQKGPIYYLLRYLSLWGGNRRLVLYLILDSKHATIDCES